MLSGIFIHNTPEDKRDSLRAALKKLTDTEALLDIAQTKLTNKEAWYSVTEDPNRTYQNKDGETMPSINRNVYGYEPVVKTAEPKTEANAKAAELMGGDLMDI